MDKLSQSFEVVESLFLDHGMPIASPSTDYSAVWLRDSFYIVMPWLKRNDGRYEKTYHRILDMLREYEWKLDIHQTKKPSEQWEFIHSKYDAYTVQELSQPWGHHQLDAVGAILYGIGEGIKHGKKIIRDEKDHEIVQKLVGYLQCVEYWNSPDNGMWEEWREVHSSSLGACIAGLQAVRDVVFVPRELIMNGYKALADLFPLESQDRPVDLAQMSLIYPYKILFQHDAKVIVDRVESVLLRKRGVIRYMGDSYYATNEHNGRHHQLSHYYGHEAEWTFGLPWLALCHLELKNFDKAREYLRRTEEVMLEDGSLPELYFSNSTNYNGNTPLGWANSMYILAKERINELN